MKLNILLRDSIIHIMLNVGIFILLMHYEFELTSRMFTFLLAVNLFCVCILTGISSKRIGASPQINGWLVGAISFGLIFLTLRAYVDVDLQVGALLFFIWSLVGFFGGLVGGNLSRTKSSV